MSDEFDNIDDNEEVLNVTDGDEGAQDRGDEFTPIEDEPKDAEDKPAEPQAKADDKDTSGEEGEGDAEAPAAKKPPQMIPKSRFDEVNEERKALLALLQKQGVVQAPAPAPAQPTFDLDAKESEYTKALLDGEDQKAAQLRREIRAYERAEAVREATAAIEQRQAQQQFTSVAQEIKASFPQLDESKDTANPEAIEYVVWKRDQLMAQGQPAHAALRAAAQAAAKTFGFDKPAPAPKPAMEDPRKVQAATRNAKAANQQPAPLAGVGERASAPQRFDVSKMSEDEFERLSLEDLKGLRGD